MIIIITLPVLGKLRLCPIVVFLRFIIRFMTPSSLALALSASAAIFGFFIELTLLTLPAGALQIAVVLLTYAVTLLSSIIQVPVLIIGLTGTLSLIAIVLGTIVIIFVLILICARTAFAWRISPSFVLAAGLTSAVAPIEIIITVPVSLVVISLIGIIFPVGIRRNEFFAPLPAALLTSVIRVLTAAAGLGLWAVGIFIPVILILRTALTAVAVAELRAAFVTVMILVPIALLTAERRIFVLT